VVINAKLGVIGKMGVKLSRGRNWKEWKRNLELRKKIWRK
jgi:hypothetical protein